MAKIRYPHSATEIIPRMMSSVIKELEFFAPDGVEHQRHHTRDNEPDKNCVQHNINRLFNLFVCGLRRSIRPHPRTVSTAETNQKPALRYKNGIKIEVSI
jgi:hypothetical protein